MIDIIALEPSDDAAIDGYAHVLAAVLSHDARGVPAASSSSVRSWLLHELPSRRTERYLARIAARPVGRLELVMPDGALRVGIQLEVSPGSRRLGVGRQLFAFATHRARSLLRTVLTARTPWTVGTLTAGDGGAGAAFARAMGLRAADLPEIMQSLTLPSPSSRFATLAAADTASPYDVVRWCGVTSGRYADDVGQLESRLHMDAPMGELAHEEPELDAIWLRRTEATLIDRSQRIYHAGAVDHRSGRLVAWTMITKEADQPHHAWQQTTVVDPNHRGRGLGLLIKAANVDAVSVAEPDVRTVYTFNAVANSHMIAVNDALGMRPIAAFAHWQMQLTR